MVWNKNAPQNNVEGRDSAADFRENWQAIEDTFEVDHNIPDDSAEGEHKKLTFTKVLGEDPTTTTGKTFLYTKNTASNETGDGDEELQAELFWKDEDGNVVQITEGGRITPRTIFIKYDGVFDRDSGICTIETIPATEPNTYTMKRVSSGSGGNFRAGLFDIVIPEQATNFFTYSFNDTGNAKRVCRIVRESTSETDGAPPDPINTYIRINIFNEVPNSVEATFVLQIRHAQ